MAGGVEKLLRMRGCASWLMGEPSSLPPPGTAGRATSDTFFAPRLHSSQAHVVNEGPQRPCGPQRLAWSCLPGRAIRLHVQALQQGHMLTCIH